MKLISIALSALALFGCVGKKDPRVDAHGTASPHVGPVSQDINLSGTFTTEDGASVTGSQWVVVSGPGFVDIIPLTQTVAIAHAHVPGQYVFRFIVTWEGDGSNVSDAYVSVTLFPEGNA